MSGTEEANKRPKRVILADVAREAGLSVPTVSHVLANTKTVKLPEATRQRVLEAAERVGYRPNRLAQAMKSGRTQVIGVWMPIDRLVFTYLRFLQAVSIAARESNHELMIVGLDGSTAYSGSREVPSFWPVDGLIAIDAGKAVNHFREDRTNDNVPVVVLGYEEFSNSDSVAWDVAGAAKLATNNLILKGCRKIVHVTLDWILVDYPREQRRRGYTEAMTEAGLEPTFVTVKEESSLSSAEAVGYYIESYGCPDAFFGMTDTLAVGATNALLQRGINVPKECKVWGFGDFPEGAEHRVPLSTIRVPVVEAVGQAWSWLLDRVENPETEHKVKVLNMDLIERESS